jgi:single-strand DNA-binding protein
MSAPISFTGNLAADPELRFTSAGKAVAKFTVMTSRRKKTPSGEWEDSDVTAWPVTAWDRLGENVAESLVKGTTVTVTGYAATNSWTDKEGQQRSRVEVTATDVAVSLKWHPARSERTERSGGSPKPADNPWDAPADDIPPF